MTSLNGSISTASMLGRARAEFGKSLFSFANWQHSVD